MALDFSKLSALFKTEKNTKPEGRGVIGVDVGSSSIKIVQLHDAKGVATLDTYGELQLGPYDDVEIGRTTRPNLAKLVEAFVDILREAAASSRQVAISMSYSSSFTAVITMPTDDQEKIASMIPIEARKYVPVPLTDVTLDWFPVSSHPERKITKILLAAIHNESLSRYESMVRGADLKTACTEIELFSTIRSSVSQEDTTVAIIDFGASSTKLYIVHRGVLSRTHSVFMSGVELTNLISKHRSIDFRAAEELKRTKGFGLAADVSDLEKALRQTFERSFREMHTVIKRYEEEEGNTVNKIILTGGGALFQGLLPYTKDIFLVDTALADPFSKVSYPAFLEDTLKEAGPVFAVAVGAALRGLHEI